MKITCLGHAGLYIEARQASILCDPWFGPAFYGSWFPFPDNSDVNVPLHPDYLFVSHSHDDHFDPQFLSRISRQTQVILPDFPIPELKERLAAIGLTRFIRTTDGEPINLESGLTVTVFSNSTPADGPMGDSALAVYDGETRIFNQNDSRPHDLDAVKALGPYDVHFCQHSGAVWWPEAYRMLPKARDAAVRRKRKNQLDRFIHYSEAIDAEFVVPNSGPPCFLDPELFHLNFDSIFPDQTDALARLGDRGVMMTPGSKMWIPGDAGHGRTRTKDLLTVIDGVNPDVCFGEAKERYLLDYQRRNVPTIKRERDRLLRCPNLREELVNRMAPLVRQTDLIAKGIGGNVVIDWHGPGRSFDGVCLNFTEKTVKPWRESVGWVHRLTIPQAILEDLVARREQNWVDDFWPSMYFKAERRGPYNDYVGAFFRCLSPERLKYAEAWFAAQKDPDQESWEVDGWKVQRRCPHARADLARTGRLEGCILTCTAHGLRWDLQTGECMDHDNLPIRAARAERPLSFNEVAQRGIDAHDR
jgi:UDP-MurNAc hydroxylase